MMLKAVLNDIRAAQSQQTPSPSFLIKRLIDKDHFEPDTFTWDVGRPPTIHAARLAKP